mgnify:CR=1 FL=1
MSCILFVYWFSRVVAVYVVCVFSVLCLYFGALGSLFDIVLLLVSSGLCCMSLCLTCFLLLLLVFDIM